MLIGKNKLIARRACSLHPREPQDQARGLAGRRLSRDIAESAGFLDRCPCRRASEGGFCRLSSVRNKRRDGQENRDTRAETPLAYQEQQDGAWRSGEGKILSDSSVSWLVWLRVPMAVRSRESSSHHLNCGIVGTLMRGGGYFGSVSDPARVNQLIGQRECTSVCWASDSLKFNLMVSADC